MRKLTLFCLFLAFPWASFAFSGGSGTQQDPYLLRNCPELQSMIGFVSSHFQLIDNINCNGFDYGDGGGFMPIGNSSFSFTGSLDGNNFTISYLNINRSTRDYVGLIGHMRSPGSIKNLTVTNSSVVGKNRTGGIVGFSNSTGTITQVSFSGNVYGNGDVGGLGGTVNDSTISNSHVVGNVTAISYNVGGLVGDAYSTKITNSSAKGEVKSTSTSDWYVGGLIGKLSGSFSLFEKNFADSKVTGYNSVGGLIGHTASVSVKNCYANAFVYGTQHIGGLIGSAGGSGSIVDSYVQGEALGEYYVGGLIGSLNDSFVMTNTYAATLVKGDFYAGGLVGRSTNTVNNSYWDVNISGQSDSAGGTAKTTQEMFQQSTYTNWNFTNTWKITQGLDYPRLQWEK